MDKKCDVLIIGAGPAGIFTALELLRRDSSARIMLVDQGLRVDKRKCPKTTTGKCVRCRPHCHITSGFSGAGAFSDGKLSLSTEVGGDLPDLLGAELAASLIGHADKIYLSFGADEKIEGVSSPDAVKEIRKRAIRAGLTLVDCPIRHLGTDSARILYTRIQESLLASGVSLVTQADCTDLLIEDGVCQGAIIAGERVLAGVTVVAVGRMGAGWLEQMCARHNIENESGAVDIGVRLELRSEIMEEVNEALYESKLVGYPLPFKNKVRTFCQNPGGFVAQENYADGLSLVNGHSYKHLKSNNTNVAILCSHRFSTPFNEPILYAKKVAQLLNMLGGGSILVQRLGDIREGKRTHQHELSQSTVRPTLPDAVGGDITSAIPYRTMTSILSFIEQMDKVVPGFGSSETLLYAPEIKFYGNRIKMDSRLNTSIKQLYCLGDSSGWTRGLMMASAMGLHMAEILSKK